MPTPPTTNNPISPSTIDEVLAQLTQIIADAEKTGDRIGYFAALYYKVTAKVKEGIDKNEFENGPRMERLDVLFASRYLDALREWQQTLNRSQRQTPTQSQTLTQSQTPTQSQALTRSWKTAFEATRSSSLLVLQQLLLGINAHINLDLGIAAVEATQAGQSAANQSGQLDNIQKDFDAINTIIGSLTFEVIHEIDRVSPLLSLIGLHADNTDSLLIQFSIGNARDGAWCFAEELSKKSGSDYTACIDARDKDIAKLAQTLIKTSGLIGLTLWIIHLFEWKSARKIIGILNSYKKQFMKAAALQ
ncbi:MAG TPA: DUF5995 family protein [Puia sp.]|jgi:hypothetical protein|nr:DUF5995 family protein [Puia sp.]